MGKVEFFSDYGDGNRYQVLEVIGKGSYGLVCSAIDTQTGEKVAIKRINDVFDHVSDAIRILREIKLLRFLKHPDIVEIKHIMLPPSPRDFKDIYVVFELMEADLHQVIKANDDLSQEHYRFFLYQLLRALKFIHGAKIFHRDLKPKNILANSDCKLKVCDFGLARVTLNGSSSAIFWTDYVATRWYRAPELCGSFYTKYTTAVDIWSIGCIFAELITRKPLFPGKNVAHQLDLITDVLGTPSADVISRIRNEKARQYLSNMRRKNPVRFQQKFPNVDPSAIRLLQRLLAFDPKDRPTAEEALADPYFKGLSKIEREPSSEPASKSDFDFERKKLSKDDVRELIYREILEYHPEMLKQYKNNKDQPRYMYPSAVSQLRRQFDHLHRESKEVVKPLLQRKPSSLPKERISEPKEEAVKKNVKENNCGAQCLTNKNTEKRAPLRPHKSIHGESLMNGHKMSLSSSENEDATHKDISYVKKLVKSASVSLSHHSASNPKTRSNSKVDQEDAKRDGATHDNKGIQLKSKSMGSTVAKMVAAFSNSKAFP